jgi:hypothetical protein
MSQSHQCTYRISILYIFSSAMSQRCGCLHDSGSCYIPSQPKVHLQTDPPPDWPTPLCQLQTFRSPGVVLQSLLDFNSVVWTLMGFYAMKDYWVFSLLFF